MAKQIFTAKKWLLALTGLTKEPSNTLIWPDQQAQASRTAKQSTVNPPIYSSQAPRKMKNPSESASTHRPFFTIPRDTWTTLEQTESTSNQPNFYFIEFRFPFDKKEGISSLPAGLMNHLSTHYSPTSNPAQTKTATKTEAKPYNSNPTHPCNQVVTPYEITFIPSKEWCPLFDDGWAKSPFGRNEELKQAKGHNEAILAYAVIGKGESAIKTGGRNSRPEEFKNQTGPDSIFFHAMHIDNGKVDLYGEELNFGEDGHNKDPVKHHDLSL